jgi:hypothetical protein
VASKLLRESFDQLLNDLDLSLQDLAGALLTTQRTIDRWYNGDSFPQHDSRRRVDALIELRGCIYKSLKSGKAARQWMHTDNRYLGGMKPVEVLRAGRIDRVEAALVAMDEGMFV